MLSIGKLGRGQEGYYLGAVARGVEDYYLGSGEAPGRWIGAGAAGLGLAGRVEAAGLTAVLDGRHPTTTRSLIELRRPDRLPGFDLTFSAPKGLSLLFALADPQTSLAVRRAHDQAVAQALRYLEREAGEVRRGRDGVTRLAGGGFVAAAFRHRTSRAGDPQLHTHVLVANMTRGADRRWSALDGRQLYLQAKTAGTLYQTALRHQLRDLGLDFTLRSNGQCELAGVPRPVLRAFSRRRVEIEAALAARGDSSPRAAQIAALATRKAKQYGVHPESLAAGWHVRADALGFDAAACHRLIGQTEPEDPGTAELARAAGLMLGPTGLTERTSTFDRRAVLQAWCLQLPAGLPVDAVERLADRLLTVADVVAIDPPGAGQQQRPGAERSLRRYSTRELLAIETAVLAAGRERRQQGIGAVTPADLAAALAAAPQLGDEQRDMVARITTSGDGVDLVIGKAGTGKTSALAAARHAWREGGQPVLGAAVAARAAVGLSEDAGIAAMTVARLLRTPQAVLPGSVLVVDEAGMLGTRQLAQLLEITGQASAKLVLVGDYRQLPELAAGGAFRGLAAALGAAALTENRRQVEPWERLALDHLRHGTVDTAVDRYADASRIDTQPGSPEQKAALVAAWQGSLDSSGDPAEMVMLAVRRADVTDLNERAREALRDAGQLTGPAVTGHDPDTNAAKTFCAGDIVLARRNTYQLGLINGQRGTVVRVEPHNGSLTVRFGHLEAAIPRWYLDAGWLDHGYALTVHQAQGLTVRRAFLLGTASLYREAGYVGLSRGREHNQLFLAQQPDAFATDPSIEQTHLRQPEADALTAIREVLTRSRAQQMAIDIEP